MNTICIANPWDARSFLERIELDESSLFAAEATGQEGDSLRTLLPSYQADKDQAVIVGSQITEFAANVPADLRPQVSNSFLLAQLAANKHIKTIDGASGDWYKKYIEVLANVGWLVEENSDAKRKVAGSSLQVHKEILPIIAAALGPSVAAVSLITTALNGLENMDKDSPWITLFDHESQRAEANQFQISYVDASDDASPRTTVTCFELNASRAITQVLFFKFSHTTAELSHFQADLGINAEVFNRVKDVVEDKVASYVSGYIRDIEI